MVGDGQTELSRFHEPGSPETLPGWAISLHPTAPYLATREIDVTSGWHIPPDLPLDPRMLEDPDLNPLAALLLRHRIRHEITLGGWAPDPSDIQL